MDKRNKSKDLESTTQSAKPRRRFNALRRLIEDRNKNQASSSKEEIELSEIKKDKQAIDDFIDTGKKIKFTLLTQTEDKYVNWEECPDPYEQYKKTIDRWTSIKEDFQETMQLENNSLSSQTQIQFSESYAHLEQTYEKMKQIYLSEHTSKRLFEELPERMPNDIINTLKDLQENINIGWMKLREGIDQVESTLQTRREREPGETWKTEATELMQTLQKCSQELQKYENSLNGVKEYNTTLLTFQSIIKDNITYLEHSPQYGQELVRYVQGLMEREDNLLQEWKELDKSFEGVLNKNTTRKREEDIQISSQSSEMSTFQTASKEIEQIDNDNCNIDLLKNDEANGTLKNAIVEFHKSADQLEKLIWDNMDPYEQYKKTIDRWESIEEDFKQTMQTRDDSLLPQDQMKFLKNYDGLKQTYAKIV